MLATLSLERVKRYSLDLPSPLPWSRLFLSAAESHNQECDFDSSRMSNSHRVPLYFFHLRASLLPHTPFPHCSLFNRQSVQFEVTVRTLFKFLPIFLDSCKIMYVSLCPKLEFMTLHTLCHACTQKALSRVNDYGFLLPCITHLSHSTITIVFRPYNFLVSSLFFSFSGYGCVASPEYLMSITVLLMLSVLVSFLVAVIKFLETFC